jgi:regulator of sigma E protease
MAVIDIAYNVFAFLVMISIIVTVHEYGHYAAARIFGLVGTHFSIGFGPKIASWTDRKGTEWRIAPILLGGYVKFPEGTPETLKPGQKTLVSLPRWQRAIVVAAGPGINFLLAGVLFAAIAYFYGYPTGRPIITQVTASSPAAAAGLKVGDQITRIDGARILLASDVTQRVIMYPGRTVTIDLLRNGMPVKTTATLASKPYDDGLGNRAQIGQLGVQMPQSYERSPSLYEAATRGVADGVFTVSSQVISLYQIATGQRQIIEMSGPVRIAKMAGHTMSLGLLPFLYLMAMISASVGLINILPVPVLDGGHIATYAVEAVIRRDIPERVAQALLGVGIVLISALGILAITLDTIALS